MIQLPFKMTFDLDFISDIPGNNLFDKLCDLFLNIDPKPSVNLYFSKSDKNLYEFIFELLKHLNLNIVAINPSLDDLFLDLIKKQIINIKITDFKYDLYKIKGIYNLILPASNNIYQYLKKIDDFNINKITIYHNKDNVSYNDFQNQLELINKDDKINKKCYLLPYLEEHEQEIYYSEKGEIRPFLTCCPLWSNPKIDSEGKISMPCYLSKNSIMQKDFFDLWNADDLDKLRAKLVESKQFSKCKYCDNFYKDNFLIVEDSVLQYKNKKFVFDNVLNPIKSAPMVAIISNDRVCSPISLYSDKDIQKIYNDEKLVLLIK